MSLSTHAASSPIDRERHDAAEYMPDIPPSLAVWLMLRTRPVSRHGLVGYNKHCMVCEQFVCNFWTEVCGFAVEWYTKEEAKKKLATLPPQPYLRRRLSEDSVERSARTLQQSAVQPPITCLPPNPQVSNISAQLAQIQTSIRPCQPRITTKGTPPKYCRWDETNVHTCCSPAGSCKVAVQILTPGCRHIIGQDCLLQWIVAGKNWCRFCGTIWFKEEKNKIKRMALLKECYQGRADHVELWGARLETEYCQQIASQHGAVRECEWKGILTRELERMILGQCGDQKDLDSMRREVLKMDPSFVETWDKLKEDLEEQCCSDAISPWTVDEYSLWDPYQTSSKPKGIEVPRRRTPRAPTRTPASPSLYCQISFS